MPGGSRFSEGMLQREAEDQRYSRAAAVKTSLSLGTVIRTEEGSVRGKVVSFSSTLADRPLGISGDLWSVLSSSWVPL